MPAARRPARQQPPQPTWAPVALAFFGVLAAFVLLWFGYPGMVACWLLLTVGAWMAPPALFTGKKDASGFPTAAHPGETRAMQRYRFWADLKWHLIFPSSALLPGWPVYASWLYGLVAAAAFWCLPHAGADVVGALPRHLDALAAFVVVTQVAAARRRTVVPADVSPGVRINAIKQMASAPRLGVALGALAGLFGALVGGYLAAALFPTPPVPAGEYAWAVLGAVGGLGLGVSFWWVGASLAEWRTLVAGRAEWAPRWQMLKHDPAPTLIRREKVGNATVDTFMAPGSMGAMAYWPLAPKVTPTMGAGQRIAILSTPNTDSQGQPTPGTRHPLQFQVVYWPADALPDVTALDADPEEVRLLLQAAMVWACDESGYARPILDEATPIALMGVEGAAPEAPVDGEDGQPPVPQASARQAWATTWLLPDGPPMKYVRTALGPSVAGHLGVEVLVDHRSERLYAGGLTDGSTVFDPSTGVDENALMALAIEDTWNGRWAEILKQDVNPPTIEHATYAEAQLANGKTLYRQAFVTLRGVDPMDFFGLEPKIKATLDAAPYVAVCGWASRGRVGERHPQAFTVYWSPEAVPPNPDVLVPTGERAETAAQWVLSGRMNEAFKAARLAAPEVYEVKCLTRAQSRGHIWRMALRLYGGVTLADVRGASQRIRQALGSQWLRVEAAKDGCVIVAGATPSTVRLANPERDQRYLASLDWEQAFLDAKVAGVGGLTPSLTSVDHLPRNEQVQVLDFDLPSGLAFVDVKSKTKALETSSKNAFVEVRRHPSGKADEFRILASEVNPMPERAPFDYEGAEPGDHTLPFATNLFGEPTCYDNAVDAHLLISGTSGGGKSVALQNFIYGALVRQWGLYVIDPSKGAVDFNFAEPYATAVGRTVWEARGMIAAIYAEVQRRKSINSQHNCGNYRDLPEEVRYSHVLVVLDEFTSLMVADPLPKTGDDSPEGLAALESTKAINAAKAYIGTYVGKIVREARSTGFTIVLATQSLKADTLNKIPGANDLKDNLSRMIVGRASFGQLQAALKMPTEAPDQPDALPPGRGMYEGNGRPAETIQCWYEPSQATFSAHLADRIAPLPLGQRLDLSGFVEPDLEVDGMRIDSAPLVSPVVPREAPVVTDLGEIELSLDDLELSLDDLEAADVEQAPAAPQTDPLDASAPSFDWDAAEAAAEAAPEPEMGEVEVEEHVVWDEIDPGPWLPEQSRYGWDEIDALLGFIDEFPETRSVEWGSARLAQPSPAGPSFRTIVDSLLAERGVAFLGGGHDQKSSPEPAPAIEAASGVLAWDVADSAASLPAESEYGWPEIDALLIALDEQPEVVTVVWHDPRLDEEDDLGIPFREVVVDLLTARGVALADPPLVPAVPIRTPAEPDDEFESLPTVPAHLIPDDDPFA